MKFTKWIGQTDKKENWYEFVKRMRANEEREAITANHTVVQPSHATFYPPIDEKEKTHG